MHDVGTIGALGHAALRALGPQSSQHCVFSLPSSLYHAPACPHHCLSPDMFGCFSVGQLPRMVRVVDKI